MENTDRRRLDRGYLRMLARKKTSMLFRYPGGKSKILDIIADQLYPFLRNNPLKAYYEPFVGGGSVLCRVAKDFPDYQLFINDKDVNMYSFWKLTKGTQSEVDEFYELLSSNPTIDLFNRLRETEPTSDVERAYYAVFFNRCTFSGIHTAGPIGGTGQKSKWAVDCRYNLKEIKRKFEEMRTLFKDRLNVNNLDILEFLKWIPADAPMYSDPPYYVKGKSLYPEFMVPAEHEAMALAMKLRRNWLLSYDICPQITQMYEWAEKIPLNMKYSINGKKETHVDKEEYLIKPI